MERALNNLVAGNTNLGWWLTLRVWLFYGVCALQKFFPIVPRLSLTGEPSKDLPDTPPDARQTAGVI